MCHPCDQLTHQFGWISSDGIGGDSVTDEQTDGRTKAIAISGIINVVIEVTLFKTSVMVTNEPKHEYQERSRPWSLGGNTIEEMESYIHLGVVYDKYMSLDISVEDSCQNNTGIYEDGFQPLTLIHLYETIVLPKVL